MPTLNSIRIAPLFAASVLLLGVAAFGDPSEPTTGDPTAVPEEVSLQYKFTPGQSMRLSFTGKTSMLGLLNGRPATDHVHATFKANVNSKCLGERDGFWTLRQSVDAPVMKVTAKGLGYDVDIRNGKKTVRLKGKVLPPEKVPPQIANVAIPQAIQNKQVRVDRLGNVSGDAEMGVDGMPRLPEQLLRVGDGWTTERERKDRNGSRTPVVTHHTLKSLDRRDGRLLAVIESESIGITRIGASGTETSHRTNYVFDVDAGYVVSGKSKLTFSTQKLLQGTVPSRSRGGRTVTEAMGRFESEVELNLTQAPISAPATASAR